MKHRSRRSKRRKEKRAEAPNFPERIAKTAQVLSNLNENFFDFLVKKFCGSSLGPRRGVLRGAEPPAEGVGRDLGLRPWARP
jgi:hypothetical protein